MHTSCSGLTASVWESHLFVKKPHEIETFHEKQVTNINVDCGQMSNSVLLRKIISFVKLYENSRKTTEPLKYKRVMTSFQRVMTDDDISTCDDVISTSDAPITIYVISTCDDVISMSGDFISLCEEVITASDDIILTCDDVISTSNDVISADKEHSTNWPGGGALQCRNRANCCLHGSPQLYRTAASG